MQAITVVGFAAALIHASSCANNKLFVTFSESYNESNNENSYYELPRSLNRQSSREGWKIADDRRGKNGVAVVCRNYDYRVCLLVDRKNSVAGLQISSAVADLQRTNAPVKPQLERKIVLGTEVYAATIMFVGNDVLKAGGRVLTNGDETAPNGLFVRTQSGQRQIPRKEADLAGSKYVKQRCFPGMGRHYFYGLSKQSDCATLDVYLPLYSEQTQELVGIVYTSFGNETVQRNGRQWYEYLPASDYAFIAPAGPDCVTDYISNYGAHSLHFYITDEPWNLKCEDS